MYSFLFDILPDTGHVRTTLELASLLKKKGHSVCYTDSSDSVFTNDLMDEDIHRAYYPGDFRFYTPDLVLLDYELQDRVPLYQRYGINYMFLNMQLLGSAFESYDSTLLFRLPPSPRAVPPPDIPSNKLSDWLITTKKDENRIIIFGLLEEGGYSPKQDNIYEAVKKSCITNPRYQVILLTNNKKSVRTLFPLPNNMMIYRTVDLPSILPFCDVALISGDLNTMIEAIQANVPTITYPVSENTEQNRRISGYLEAGLGIDGQVKKMTSEVFEQQIAKVMQQKEEIQVKLQATRNLFESENKKLYWPMDLIIAYTRLSK